MTGKAAAQILLALLLSGPLPVSAAAVVIHAAGDVMLGGRWERQVARDGYFHPFERIAPELKKGDLTLVNLEAPLTSRGTEFLDKKYRFRVRPTAAAALRQAGITTVALANNHSMDFGAEGLLDTLRYLSQAGIGHVGAGEDLAGARTARFYDIRGTTVAFLGYSLTLPQEFWAGEKRPGTAPLFEKLVQEDIAAARRKASIVLVTVHWGEEGSTQLREYQPRLGRMMIDAGADAVIGHHPHILQGIEVYRRGIIFYSLGNFAFAAKSRQADRSLLVRLTFDGDRRTAELMPLNIRHGEVGFQPKVMTGAQGDEVVQRLKRLPPATVTIRSEGERRLIDF